ncbi:MAG: metallopeptidase family protein [Thermoanaerobaculia bacterium]
MLRMGVRDFESVVSEALAGIPDDLATAIENVAVTVEDEPSVEDLRAVGLDPEIDTLYGLYQGVPLPERGPSTYGLDLPDRIVVYRLPLLEACRTRRELLREIRDTVIHELGHYFGLPEEELP